MPSWKSDWKRATRQYREAWDTFQTNLIWSVRWATWLFPLCADNSLTINWCINWTREVSPLWAIYIIIAEMMLSVWSVLSKCLFPCLPGGQNRATCCKILYAIGKAFFKFVFRHVNQSTRLADFHWAGAGQSILLESHSSMFCRPGLPLCFLSCRSTQSGACIAHCLSLFHITSLSGCYLSKMADRRTLMPSDTQCSSCIVYHTESHLSWAYINNYRAPVALIIVVSVQRYVFCCCQETEGWNELSFFFFSCLEQPWFFASTVFWSNWQANSVCICFSNKKKQQGV